MARARRRVALVLAAAGFALAGPAAAQGLRTLQVDALAMRADRTHLHVGEIFHLAIHAHVRQRVAALDELVVPNVGTMLLEGDERRVAGSTTGTDVIETLTLEPTVAGAFTFNAAYLDATDARTGKPTRFSSNPVRVVVDPPAPSSAPPPAPVSRELREIVVVGGALVAMVVIAIALLRMRGRRVAPPAAAARPAAAAPVPPPAPRDEVVEALRAYRTAPANGSLIRLRGALFTAAGAPPGATLRDALASTGDLPLRRALGAAERTAFGPAYLRDASSVELIDATQTWLA